MDGPRPESRSRGLDVFACWLVVCLPIALGAWRASTSAQWRADLPSIRDLGLASVGFGGSVSTALTQVLSLLPLGNQSYRAALGAAIAAGVAGLFIHRVARRLIATTAAPSWLVTILAAVASLMATLSPTWQSEATIAGGATVAAALLFFGVDALFRQTEPGARRLTPEATRGWLGIAGLVGLTLAESIPAGATLLLAVVATCLAAEVRPPIRSWPVLGAITGAALVIGLAPTFLRPLAPRNLADVGRALSSSSLDALALASSHEAALLSWATEMGALPLLLALAGLVVGVWREARRAWSTAIVALVVLDLAYPAAATGTALAPLAPVRLGGIGALAIAASLGMAEATLFLRGLKVPMARTASVLAVVFHATVVGLTCEEAAFVADRSEHHAAEEWTDLALEQLPRGAAILVHSPALTWRLWAAQALSGQRPDVLVIPAPLLERGEVMRHLVPAEAAVSQLLQDYALHGVASEYGLSLLADARPLRVELDPRWDAQIVDHLRVKGPWLELMPSRLGRSDRQLARRDHVLGLEGRVGRHVQGVKISDRTSAVVIARTLKEHVTALSLLGMRGETASLIDGVERLAPDDPFVTGARLRLSHAERQRDKRVELRDLLAFDRFDESERLVY